MKKVPVIFASLALLCSTAFGQKGKLSLGIESGLSLPLGTFSNEYMALPGYSASLSAGYLITDNMSLFLSGGIMSNPFDGQTTASNLLASAEPDVYGEEPIRVKVSNYSSYQSLLFSVGYGLHYPIGEKVRFDLKLSIGMNSFYDSGGLFTTYYDDAPYNLNMREEYFVSEQTNTSVYTQIGIGFRYAFNNRISAGLSFDFGSSKKSYTQDVVITLLDDLTQYDLSIDEIKNSYSVVWFNSSGGIYFLLGKGK